MTTLNVVNLKCGGCEKSVASSLEKLGLTEVSVDATNQTVSFEGDKAKAVKKLATMGYPEASSPQAKSLLKKAKSYTSCMIGKLKS